MKELTGVNANFLCAFSEAKELVPKVEVILIVSEPKYGTDEAGKATRNRECDTLRFCATPMQLNLLSDSFKEMAQEITTMIDKGKS